MKTISDALDHFPSYSISEYVLIALIISAYHSYRGYRLQRWTEEQYRQNADTIMWELTPREAFWTRHFYDGFFYFFASMVGFISLSIALYILDTSKPLNKIEGGTATLIIFLLTVGILGIGGKLPHVIDKGKGIH